MHKQAKGKYRSEMRENIKPLAKSFKRTMHLHCTPPVIASVRKRSFPVYEATPRFSFYFHEFFAPLPVARPMADGYMIKAFGDVEMHAEREREKVRELLPVTTRIAKSMKNNLGKRN